MRMIAPPNAMDGTAGPNFEVPLYSDNSSRPGWMYVSASKTQELGFGSAHPGQTNAVMSDGSTHSLSNTTDMYLLQALGERSDGIPANVPQ